MAPTAGTRSAVAGLVCACVVLGLMVAARSVAAQDRDSPRNIVFIFTDDQRFDGLGLRNDYFETPRLDQLAEGGILFENALRHNVAVLAEPRIYPVRSLRPYAPGARQ